MVLDNKEAKEAAASEKSKIEKLPEAARKKILIASLLILMMIIVTFWLFSLKFFAPPAGKPKDQNWQEITTEFSDLTSGVKESVSQIKDQFNQLLKFTQSGSMATSTEQTATTTATAAPVVSGEEIEKLKEKILEKSQ